MFGEVDPLGNRGRLSTVGGTSLGGRGVVTCHGGRGLKTDLKNHGSSSRAQFNVICLRLTLPFWRDLEGFTVRFVGDGLYPGKMVG